MQNRIPIKNLSRLNWLISLMSCMIFFVFFWVLHVEIPNVLSRLLEIFVFTATTSFCNLAFLTFFLNGKYANAKRFALSYIMAFVIWFVVKELHIFITGIEWEGEKNSLTAYMMAVLTVSIFNTIILLLHNLVMLLHNKAQWEIESLQLRANVTESTNLLLRQQIHPHFLFNALNTVKSLYKKDLAQGEEYLVHLANFLRVSISNHTTKTTLIKNELEFCMDYLKMQKIRFGGALQYYVNLSEQTINSSFLPFFSLQPLVENVLKHNELTEERPILIKISEEGGYISVSNNLQERTYKENSTQQGLFNLAERYRLLGEESITIIKEDSTFTVCVKILNK